MPLRVIGVLMRRMAVLDLLGLRRAKRTYEDDWDIMLRRKGHMEPLKQHKETHISLSLLEYESHLLKHLNHLADSKVFSKTIELVNSGKLYSLHIDVMRPPLIPGRSAFPIELIRHIYENLHERIILDIHLMVKEPDFLIQEISEFIQPEKRTEISMTVQREGYSCKEGVMTALRIIRNLGYRAGIGLDLPTRVKTLTDEMIEKSDLVLLMSVPMGKGGQKYDEEATERIKELSSRFPEKPIGIDGGINDKTTVSAKKAGATIFVIGSFVTMSRKPLEALEKLKMILEDP